VGGRNYRLEDRNANADLTRLPACDALHTLPVHCRMWCKACADVAIGFPAGT
jgi:hypothetical protein